MSWMSEIALIIEEARAQGFTLTLSDFGRVGDTLTIDGMPADQWYELVMTDEWSS